MCDHRNPERGSKLGTTGKLMNENIKQKNKIGTEY
jgi:hypothetical protein